MNAIGLLFTLIVSAFLLSLPRRLAAIPLLIGAAYMTRGQVLEIGPAHFDVIRILVTVGFFRVLLKGESIANKMNSIDRMLIPWALWLITSSAFHTSDAWVFRAGMVWTDLGCYFLFRIFVQNAEDVKYIFQVICVLLIPVAILMLLEKLTGKNYFSALGGVNASAAFRDGHFRAQGPFAHAILAGTVGAGCFPMALYLWKSHRRLALMGLFGAGGMVFAATSSGPIMMVFFILFGLLFWKVRKYLRAIRWLALLAVIVLDMIMKDPVYYLMARIDLGGGSKGWHRARLIESSIEHLNEWWLTGTDYTRHWMSTGVHSNTIHTDITNHFLGMGVTGGLPLMILWVMVLVAAFAEIGKALRQNENAPVEHNLLIWTLGAIMFGHVANYFSISYFDQSIVFFYLILASIGAVQNTKSYAFAKTEQSVQCIKQSRYVAVGVIEVKKGISQQKTHTLWKSARRVNFSIKDCCPRRSIPWLSNSSRPPFG
ncbi:MAG: hypothetical protein PSU93_11245 [Methylobacter sp.]|uniref:O-antigen ligase domain-containing protein n=1 Tax=Candidatus Methylobacter titanis TaxID=3053457 RepID=A0AA43TKY6_9GAMM|nr:hypothetical protein [Candidatus Methylobacter titanis]